MRLYHIAGTRSSRVRWALEEAGLAHEIENITRDERKEPAHLARHPLGRVPVVHDGQGYVFESAAIALHIADLAPAGTLIAAPGSHDRALQYQWVVYAMVEMESGIMERYLYGESDPARSAAGVERYRTAAQVVEDALAGKEWLVGDSFSVADLIVAGVTHFGAYLGMNDGFANIAAHLARCDARPAYQRAND